MGTRMRPELRTPKESDEQTRFVVWLKKKGVRVVASANGGSRHFLEACRMKNMGVSPGFPDIQIPYPCGDYHGLFIEMKRLKGGRTSTEQQDWIVFLRGQGYRAEVAHGCEEAIEIYETYMSFFKPAA